MDLTIYCIKTMKQKIEIYFENKYNKLKIRNFSNITNN